MVKAKVKTVAKAKGKTAKSASASKVKTAAKAKVVPKVVAKSKPAPKAVVKAKAKPAPKVVVKAVVKATAKPAAKPIPKPMPAASMKVEARVPGIPTEAELIKQPKAEYMSAAQRKFFKRRLLEIQTQMRDNADATTEHLRELAVAPDPADRATQEEEHALELRTRDRERKLLKKIEGALLRIEEGSYGYCEETGDPIGIPRLLARPTATLTIEAQERRELKQKMYGE